jgi:hypothetical protein
MEERFAIVIYRREVTHRFVRARKTYRADRMKKKRTRRNRQRTDGTGERGGENERKNDGKLVFR